MYLTTEGPAFESHVEVGCFLILLSSTEVSDNPPWGHCIDQGFQTSLIKHFSGPRGSSSREVLGAPKWRENKRKSKRSRVRLPARANKKTTLEGQQFLPLDANNQVLSAADLSLSVRIKMSGPTDDDNDDDEDCGDVDDDDDEEAAFKPEVDF